VRFRARREAAARPTVVGDDAAPAASDGRWPSRGLHAAHLAANPATQHLENPPPGLKPGRYRVVVSPDDLARLGVMAPETEFTVSRRREEALIEGIVVRVTRAP
jgi:hypothetical protein